jgi:hypothetical protein
MEKRELQEVLLEKLSSIERSLHLIAFSMYRNQTKPEDGVQWDEFDIAEYEKYLDEGKELFDLDKLFDKIRKKGKE